MILSLVAIVAGLALLSKAADQFVMGAARLAIAMRLSAVVVGAVVIGFGTSAPEMLVSGIAAIGGQADIGIGNIVGSNVANLTLVLAIAAMVTPIFVASSVIGREAPLSVGSVVVFAVLVQDGVSALEGAVLFVLLIVVLVVLIRSSRQGGEELLESEVDEFLDGEHSHPVDREAARTVLGLLGTMLGAHLLVTGAVDVADEFGLSGGFVGLTLVAIGTSLPELVTSVVAARKGETDLIVGNLLGSNVFNSLAVGAIVGFFGPGTVEDPTLTGLATYLMVGSALLATAFMWQGGRVGRVKGAILLVAYLGAMPFLA